MKSEEILKKFDHDRENFLLMGGVRYDRSTGQLVQILYDMVWKRNGEKIPTITERPLLPLIPTAGTLPFSGGPPVYQEGVDQGRIEARKIMLKIEEHVSKAIRNLL